MSENREIEGVRYIYIYMSENNRGNGGLRAHYFFYV